MEYRWLVCIAVSDLYVSCLWSSADPEASFILSPIVMKFDTIILNDIRRLTVSDFLFWIYPQPQP